MKLIVGLGNPGEKYQNNRHNAGFMFVDYLINEFSGFNGLKLDKKLNSQLAQLAINNKKIILVKPQTFMNNSGQAVKNVIDYYKISLHNVIIAHDDLDIVLGDFKIQSGTGPKLHNGISSIEDRLGTNEFLRIRIGVENRDPETNIDGKTYVLSDFTASQHDLLNGVFPKIYERMNQQFLNVAS